LVPQIAPRPETQKFAPAGQVPCEGDPVVVVVVDGVTVVVVVVVVLVVVVGAAVVGGAGVVVEVVVVGAAQTDSVPLPHCPGGLQRELPLG
jgi:hypothetical protein